MALKALGRNSKTCCAQAQPIKTFSPVLRSRVRTLPQVSHSASAPRVTFILAASKGFGDPEKITKPKHEQGPPPIPCTCLSGKAYKNCCEPVHTGVKVAGTPEAALRTRFSAFKLGLEDFISVTTHPDYLAFHYENKPKEEAEALYAKDIHGGCTLFDYEDFSVTKSEPGESEDEGLVAFKYRSAVKVPVAAEAGTDTAVAEQEWKTTNEKARFVRVDGVWKFCDYQRFEYNMNSLLQGTPEAVK